METGKTPREFVCKLREQMSKHISIKISLKLCARKSDGLKKKKNMLSSVECFPAFYLHSFLGQKIVFEVYCAEYCNLIHSLLLFPFRSTKIEQK